MTAVSKSAKFEVIQELFEKGYTITLLCDIAKVSRSGYYKWLKRQTFLSEKQLEDTAIKTKILECHKKLKGIYGYRRIQVWLKLTYNLHFNHKRIQRLMKELGIQSSIRKKRPYYGKKEAYVISQNYLNRDFYAIAQNQKWVTDITYLNFNGQKLYLSVIKDLFNNEIVAYNISCRNDLELVIDTLEKARKKRNLEGILLHSGQGSQYRSNQYHLLLKKYQIQASMSRKGNYLDNACIESFLVTLKQNAFIYILSKRLMKLRRPYINIFIFIIIKDSKKIKHPESISISNTGCLIVFFKSCLLDRGHSIICSFYF
ncbi:IS3 family transposase [Bacillus thuringiensis]|uniref:IS3 family transposase n=1 Tax=Bacillus thuringiensis TaxID=1428 RepID=UPI000C9E704A|nr:IS3 family transposase [Bacillus thuringiensis]MEC3298320.1 IS3 family transposase [Bacillus thuringiensis]MEC3401873.1 IS3 family transposase [Bacillus thuringiensis]MED2262950.1 IS3 family transposase [Bacillus thuringiensis]MED3114978.1 IS3 family transposase [Bacillus thuringiensis]MED3214245.1 IS3 family transposase [Bacillus thuringiensis]